MTEGGGSTSDQFDVLVDRLGRSVQRNVPFGSRTTYRVGGEAALWCEVSTEQDLLAVGQALDGLDLPTLVFGLGSNMLVSDAGFEGLVVTLGAGFSTLEIDGTEVRAGAALALPTLARRTAAAGLTGLEWAVGVPGSVGGSLRMNAGGHGSDTVATLERYRWVDLADSSSIEVSEAPAATLQAGYRHTAIRATDVVTEAVHRLVPGDPATARATIDEIVRWRRANQPGGSNAGSVFVNPPGASAGRLIEECGLKGLRRGTAAVSTKHANFIQADRGGRADDVAALMHEVRHRVAEQTGIELRSEIRMIGFPGEEW